MKTDRFTDIIRRKLESIRPEPTDKDWARMQATLNDANLSQPNPPGPSNPFSGGIWSSGKSWLLAAASVSTVVLIAFSMWQQREINQLRQTIATVQPQGTNSSTPASPSVTSGEPIRPDVAHSDGVVSPKHPEEALTSANRNESQPVRPDTVYITRYVPVPSRAKPDVRTGNRSGQRLETPPEQRYAAENPITSPVTTRQPINLTLNQQTESHDASSTPSVTNKTTNESTVANKSIPNSSPKNNRLLSRPTREQGVKRRDSSPATSVDNQTNVAANSPGDAKATDDAALNRSSSSADKPVNRSEPSGSTNEVSAQYELAKSRPLSLESKNWGAVLAQQAKRMQPTRSAVTVVAEPAKAPTGQIQRVATRFRAGVGGEIASRLWSAGVFTEVLVGRHWAVGVGLNQATYTNRFITDEDFNVRTKRDFRKEFGRGIDPRREILNIDTRQVRLQLPVSLGYRVPLNRTLTLLPTVGTFLNLTNSENVTYYCRPNQRPPMQPQAQPGFDEIRTTKSQPVDLINSLSLGAGLEWQAGHWVVQATPVLTIPTQTSQQVKPPNLNGQQNTTAGLRARLLYQF